MSTMCAVKFLPDIQEISKNSAFADMLGIIGCLCFLARVCGR